ncbi:MAG: hypothetical protein O3C45_05755 [Bacteroidetes bacterium]|nr:hypothetical protein [Bacteroidota bacterium]
MIFRDSPSHLFRRLLLVLFLAALGTSTAQAQLKDARFGLGFNTLLSAENGFGMGFRGRLSTPINADLSFAGLTGFILGGRDDATWVLDPQASLIVTLPGVEKAPYLLMGIGAYLDPSDSGDTLTGPTLHLGLGWVKPLRESVLFYEIDPALIIGETKVSAAIPFRIGVIF